MLHALRVGQSPPRRRESAWAGVDLTHTHTYIYIHMTHATQMYPLRYLPQLEPGTETLDPLWPEGRGFDLLCYVRCVRYM